MKLLDACELIVDCPHSTAKDEGKGYPLIRTPNVGRGRLKLDGVHRVSYEIYCKRIERAIPQIDDLILAREAPVGNVAVIKEEQVCLGQRTVLIRPNKNIVEPDFLVYYLLSPQIQHILLSSANGATVSHLNMTDIRKLEINLPSLTIQKKIGNILSVIEDRIEINKKINDNLLQQAQALYQEMFVKTQDDSRETCKAEEYFDIAIGKTPPRKEQQWFTNNPSDVTWVSISDMGSCGTYISKSTEQLTQEAVKKFNIKVIPSNTVLLSFKLTVGRIAITHGEMTTNEAIAHFKTDKPYINEYLYCYLKDFNYQTMGSTSSIATAVNSKIIKAMPFIIPGNDEISRFHAVVGPMFEQILNNQLENDSLVEMRDTLLPRLMSGELDVSEIAI